MRGCAHAAEVHASAHAAGTHASSHAAAMPAATATTTSVKGKRRRSKGNRRTKRTRDEVSKELVVHPNSSVVELPRRITLKRNRRPRDPNDPMISTDKCDSF